MSQEPEYEQIPASPDATEGEQPPNEPPPVEGDPLPEPQPEPDPETETPPPPDPPPTPITFEPATWYQVTSVCVTSTCVNLNTTTTEPEIYSNAGTVRMICGLCGQLRPILAATKLNPQPNYD
ncbi:hypothetical protein ACIP2X_37810 [Streptomyces sp. NPDC089424]|uniref:hypothetical protein n=1 Tax=Streptomyces sp. NPDC089424 TaxID=3365917 RepID=UPI0038084CC0